MKLRFSDSLEYHWGNTGQSRFSLCSVYMGKRSEERWGGQKYWTPLSFSEGLTAAPLFARQVWLLHSCLYRLQNVVSDAVSFNVHPISNPHSSQDEMVVYYHIYLFFMFPLLNLPSCSNSTCTCCFLVLLLILNPYSHTSTHLLLLAGQQSWPEQGITKPRLKVPPFSIHLCFAHWTTQCVFQTTDNQWLHLQHLAFQSLRNFMDENPSCAIWISGEFRCSCPVSLWAPWSARWPVTLIATWVWEHLLSKQWLCPKEIVPKEKWSAWKCTQL